jgi:hypothetical protein
MRRRHFVLPTVVLTAALAATASAGSATKGCGSPGYAYAGLLAHSHAYGVAAILTATADATVEQGHVAGWVGVGSPNEGPGGTREWMQIGLNRIAGSAPVLYYETATASGIHYFDLKTQVPVGRRFALAVLEMAHRPSVWRVWLNSRPVSPPIWLPRSHGALTPMAMAENWDGGSPACNRYSYRFSRVAVAGAPGGAWTPFREHNAQVLQNAGYRVVPASGEGFVAVTNPAPIPSATPVSPVPPLRPINPAARPRSLARTPAPYPNPKALGRGGRSGGAPDRAGTTRVPVRPGSTARDR